jgi:peptide/nickel transport system permease protein
MGTAKEERENKKSKTDGVKNIFSRLRRYPTTFIGFAIVIIFLIIAAFGPLIAPYQYSQQNLADRLQPPSEDYVFGTDQFGRDIYSRILVGSRDVLMIAGSGTALAVFAGLLLGLFSGYRGGFLMKLLCGLWM